MTRVTLDRVQDHVATSYAEYMAGKCYVYHTANQLDLTATGSNRVESDGVKLVRRPAAPPGHGR